MLAGVAGGQRTRAVLGLLGCGAGSAEAVWSPQAPAEEPGSPDAWTCLLCSSRTRRSCFDGTMKSTQELPEVVGLMPQSCCLPPD